MSVPSIGGDNATGKCTDTVYPVQPPTDSAAAAGLLPAAGPTGLYLHVPFCLHKCHYCDFYSIVDDRDRQQAFTQRIIEEIHAVAGAAGRPAISTIFVGGGTPTLLAPGLWGGLLAALADTLDLSSLAEFTIEANPETVTTELLDVLVAGGVNRMSIGCQSFSPTHLKTLERWHEPANVARSVERSRAAGLSNINLDLIYAIPGQTMAAWLDDIKQAIELAPMHLSCYALTYEANTPMTVKLDQGKFKRVEESLEARMFETTIDTLAAAGYEQYEISNFVKSAIKAPSDKATENSRRPHPRGRSVTAGSAASAFRCQHNLMYWLNGDWLAIGPSASGHVQGLRWKNTPHLGQYLGSVGGAPIDAASVEKLDHEASIGEQIMLRLRLIEGIDLQWCEQSLSRERLAAVDRLIAEGQLEMTATHLRLTRRGMLLADSVIAELL